MMTQNGMERTEIPCYVWYAQDEMGQLFCSAFGTRMAEWHEGLNDKRIHSLNPKDLVLVSQLLGIRPFRISLSILFLYKTVIFFPSLPGDLDSLLASRDQIHGQ